MSRAPRARPMARWEPASAQAFDALDRAMEARTKLGPAPVLRRTHDVGPYLARQAPAPAERRAILLWDRDDAAASAPAVEMLRSQGFAVDRRAPDEPLGAVMAALEPDLVVLDMSDETLQACREISGSGRRVIVFSAQGEALDQVAALEAGADDYVLKGAHPLELLARVRAVLRRGGSVERRASLADPEDHRVWRLERRHGILTGPGDTSVRMNRSSTELLWMLSQRPQELILRRDLMIALFAPGPAPDTRALDVRVFRLRRALDTCGAGGALIRTFQGIGFVLDAVVTTAGETLSLRDARPAS